MERVFTVIDQLRSANESTRRWALMGIVGAAVLMIGVVWAVTLGWQYGSSVSAAPEEETVNASLPSLGELFSKGGTAAGEGAKSQLRDLLLGDDPVVEDAQMPPAQNQGVRLPSGSDK